MKSEIRPLAAASVDAGKLESPLGLVPYSMNKVMRQSRDLFPCECEEQAFVQVNSLQMGGCCAETCQLASIISCMPSYLTDVSCHSLMDARGPTIAHYWLLLLRLYATKEVKVTSAL